MNKLSKQQQDDLIKLMGELIEPHIPALSDAFLRFGAWLEDVSKKHSTLIQQILLTDWQKIADKLAKLPTRSRRAMDTALSQGWFFIWHHSMQTVLILIDEIEAAGNDQEKIDTLLKDHYIEHLDLYAEKLFEKYPERKFAIEAAISAHKNLGLQGYYLSTPVFLAQADGIFSETCQISMAMGKSRKEGEGVKGLEKIRDIIGTDEEAGDLLSPLFDLHQSNLLKSEKDRNAEFKRTGVVFNALNRHQVIHGEVSNYGSEINSLKAFSFLAFIGLHLPDILATTTASSR